MSASAPDSFTVKAPSIDVAPLTLGLVIDGELKVLFDNVSAPAKVDKVPVAGSVTLVAPEDVIVVSPPVKTTLLAP